MGRRRRSWWLLRSRLCRRGVNGGSSFLLLHHEFVGCLWRSGRAMVAGCGRGTACACGTCGTWGAGSMVCMSLFTGGLFLVDFYGSARGRLLKTRGSTDFRNFRSFRVFIRRKFITWLLPGWQASASRSLRWVLRLFVVTWRQCMHCAGTPPSSCIIIVHYDVLYYTCRNKFKGTRL